MKTNLSRRTASVASLVAVGVLALVLLASPLLGAAVRPSSGTQAIIGQFHEKGESASLEQNETMPNFVSGQIFMSEYEQNYFVGSNTTMQPTVGVQPTIFPTDDISTIGNFYILVPWWGPSSTPYAPAYNTSTPTMCAPANIMVCFDHPATVDVPGLGVVPTPGHDHLLDGLHGFRDIWWQGIIILVLHQSAWPGVTGMQGIVSDHNQTNPAPFTESLDQAQLNGDAAADLPTNFFLDFQVEDHGVV
jgi:hypothetical protein